MVVKGDYTKPKKGATFNVKNNYDNLNVSCETVDKIELKSIILSFNLFSTSALSPLYKCCSIIILL